MEQLERAGKQIEAVDIVAQFRIAKMVVEGAFAVAGLADVLA